MSLLLICIGIFCGYFILRFGMVSRGRLRQNIQFVGGILLTVFFILSFVTLGWKMGLLSILIFWVIITPIIEVLIGQIDKKINAPYKEAHGRLAKKYNTTPEEIKKTVYKNMDE